MYEEAACMEGGRAHKEATGRPQGGHTREETMSC